MLITDPGMKLLLWTVHMRVLTRGDGGKKHAGRSSVFFPPHNEGLKSQKPGAKLNLLSVKLFLTHFCNGDYKSDRTTQWEDRVLLSTVNEMT